MYLTPLLASHALPRYRCSASHLICATLQPTLNRPMVHISLLSSFRSTPPHPHAISLPLSNTPTLIVVISHKNPAKDIKNISISILVLRRLWCQHYSLPAPLLKRPRISPALLATQRPFRP
jgi:hypothetical protein